jgi:hypothetical protein
MSVRQPAPGIQGTPYDVTGPGQAAPETKVRSAGYWVMVHPEKWEVVRGRILPRPGRLDLSGGSSHITLQKGTNRPQTAKAFAKAAERGWVVVQTRRDGKSYLSKFGDHCVLPYWCKVFAGNDKIDIDQDALADFLQSLIGWVVAPPSRPLLEALLAQLWDERQRLVEQPHRTRELERLDIDIKAVEAALADKAVPQGDPIPSTPIELEELGGAGPDAAPAADAPPTASLRALAEGGKKK